MTESVKLVALLPLLLGGCAGLALPARPRTPTQPKLVVVRVPLARPRNGTLSACVCATARGRMPPRHEWFEPGGKAPMSRLRAAC